MSQPLFRLVYRAQCRPGQEAATAAHWRARADVWKGLQADGTLFSASVFGWGRHFFVYYETTDSALTADELAGDTGDQVVESPSRVGKLATHNSPPNWQEVMRPHFLLWDDAPAGEEIWRGIELVLHIGDR